MIKKFGLIKTNAKAVKVGDLFGRLEVVAVGQIPNTYKYYAVCRCSCGSKLKRIRFDHLLMMKVESCGCLQKERTTTHGMTSSKHFHRWRHMMERCYNKECGSYHNYGGRGIKVWKGWHDVKKFIEDLPEGYSPGLEIDRIDNNGNYEPGNIRWATKSENCDNRRSSRKVTYNGKTLTLNQWSDETGIPRENIRNRLDDGWTIKRALTVEPKEIERLIEWNGESKSISEWSRITGISHTTITGRANKGWPVELIFSQEKYLQPNERSGSKTYEYNGKQMTIKQLSELSGISTKLLRKRIQERNWPIEKAMNK